MRRIKMPEEARKIIDELYNAGYDAYIVGGCVRDALLGREADDYDITTSALPEDIKKIFKKTVDTGITHGTVTVIENGKPYEVTTFRVDGEYRDNRHPVSVSYTSNIKDDLARRDFTVNALAYNDRVGIVDAFSGMEDLNKRIIRCVRNPEERFLEDALRVLRGIRFSSVLGFEIEEKTANAIKKYSENLRSISSERIFAEWKKLLSGVNAYEVIRDYKVVVDVFAQELNGVDMPSRVGFDDLTYDERQILLFSFCPESQEAFLSFAKRIKMDSKTRDTAVSVLKGVSELRNDKNIKARTFIVGKSDSVSIKSVKVARSAGVCSNDFYETVERLIAEDSPRKISQLKVNGNDLSEIGIRGKKIGKVLTSLLFAVAELRVANDRETLLNYVKRHYM